MKTNLVRSALDCQRPNSDNSRHEARSRHPPTRHPKGSLYIFLQASPQNPKERARQKKSNAEKPPDLHPIPALFEMYVPGRDEVRFVVFEFSLGPHWKMPQNEVPIRLNVFGVAEIVHHLPPPDRRAEFRRHRRAFVLCALGANAVGGRNALTWHADHTDLTVAPHVNVLRTAVA